MKVFFSILLLLATSNLFADAQSRAYSEASSQIRSAITELRNNCSSSYSKVKDSISKAKDLKQEIIRIKDKAGNYNNVPSSVSYNLKKAKSNISSYIDAAYDFKSAMNSCDSLNLSSIYNLQERANTYQNRARDAQRAGQTYSDKAHYYNSAIEYYNKALKTLRNL